ncbi:MAG: hypothetical protein JWO57_3316, partial [Pseudonocardiales bacterium]|nr:hypothetical protein [Pseudonocardiales bacterium]
MGGNRADRHRTRRAQLLPGLPLVRAGDRGDCCALYCLVRSHGHASLRWSAAFGAFVGLMPLARTMAVAFAPGLLLAALVGALSHSGRRQRLRNLAVAGTGQPGAGCVRIEATPRWANRDGVEPLRLLPSHEVSAGPVSSPSDRLPQRL